MAPAYLTIQLEGAIQIAEHPGSLSKNDHCLRGKLYSGLGQVKAILGSHEESLQARRVAADEWRLACCTEVGAFSAAPDAYHDALDDLGVALLAAGRDKEALRCLLAAVHAAGLIWKSWAIYSRAARRKDPDGNEILTVSGETRDRT